MEHVITGFTNRTSAGATSYLYYSIVKAWVDRMDDVSAILSDGSTLDGVNQVSLTEGILLKDGSKYDYPNII